MELLCDSVHPFVIGNAENINADAASQVDIVLSLFVNEVGPFAFHKAHGISGIGMDDIGSIFFFCIHGVSPLFSGLGGNSGLVDWWAGGLVIIVFIFLFLASGTWVLVFSKGGEEDEMDYKLCRRHHLNPHVVKPIKPKNPPAVRPVNL